MIQCVMGDCFLPFGFSATNMTLFQLFVFFLKHSSFSMLTFLGQFRVLNIVG